MTGIDRPEIYTEGYAQYLRGCGETRLTMKILDGTASYEEAEKAVREQIGQGCPIPTLVLNHRNKKFREYVWHWFLINGYDELENGCKVKAVTYGSSVWLELRELWDTGHERRGGFILYHID